MVTIAADIWSYVALLGIWVLAYFLMGRAKTHPVVIKDMAVFDAFPEVVGRAAEVGRPVYMNGTVQIQSDGINAVTVSVLLNRVAELCAQQSVRLKVITDFPEGVPILEETAYNAYVRMGKEADFDRSIVEYHPGVQQGSGLGGVGPISREAPAAYIGVGPMGAGGTMLIEVETAAVLGAVSVTGISRSGQGPQRGNNAMGYVISDYNLMQEEVFALVAKLSPGSEFMGCVQTCDYVKIGMLVYAILGGILNLMGIIKL